MSESDNWLPPTPPTFSPEYETPFQKEPRAGFWWRFLGHVCDGVSTLVVAIPFQILGMLFSDSSSTSDADGFAGLSGFGGGTDSLFSLLGTIAGIYMLSRWTGSRGGSPLRVLTGVLVLDQFDGSYIGTKRAFYRVLMSYVSQIVLLLGYISMLWDPNKQTWHDKVAQSVVVKR
jgi:uncharacterized RDD family membrane protein YckC